MSFDFSTLLPMLQAAGLPGLAIALVVLVLVFLADFTNLLKSGDAKRVAVWIMSVLFANIPAGGAEAALVAAIAAVVASLAKLLIDALVSLSQSKPAA